MARTKVPPRECAIASWDEADAALKRIGEIEREVQRKESSMNAKMDAMKQGYADDVKEVLTEKENCERDLEEFARSRRVEFSDSKTKKLNFGKLSFRESEGITIHNAANTAAAIEKIMGDKASNYLHIKKTPNKEALEKLSADELAPLGCRKKSKETFSYEIAWEKLQ